MDVETERNGHSTGFGSNTTLPGGTQPSPYESSNAVASAINAATHLAGLPAKPDFEPSHHVREEAFTASPLQPVRQVNTVAPDRQLDEPPPNNAEAEVTHTAMPEPPLNGLSAGATVTESFQPAPPIMSHSRAEPEISSTPNLDLNPPTLPPPTTLEQSAHSSGMNEQAWASKTAIPHSEPFGQPVDVNLRAQQAPLSDLRSSPLEQSASEPAPERIEHPAMSDALGSGADLPVDQHSSTLPMTGPETTVHSQPTYDEAIDMDMKYEYAPAESAPVTVTEPDVQPPPAPQPTPAELVEEKLRDPTPPALPADTQTDVQMYDAPSPPGKVAREREEETEDNEPAAKRAKTESESAEQEFKVPQVPQNNAQSPTVTNGVHVGDPLSEAITPARLAHLKKIISNLKKGNSSQYFRTPVDYVAMNLPTYPDIIKTPMDLSAIDVKLKNQAYKSVAEFVDDFNLIVSNTETFNGRDHAVTQGAHKMRSSFTNQMSHLPGSGYAEPSREEKKAQKAKEQPTRNIPHRRTSTSNAPAAGSAQSPSTPSANQTFAVGPTGVPLIRRDSNMTDGRPKRAIKPPRTHDMGGGRPRKKKFEAQLRFCEKVLAEMKKPQNWEMNQYFLDPVDPVALNIPTYFQVIKKPMDLGTVQTKLSNNVYEKAKDFEEDVRQIFTNCAKFNQAGDLVWTAGENLRKFFDKLWAEKDEWINEQEPTSQPQSPGDDDEENEESEEEPEESDDDRQEKIAALQKQMEAVSQQMRELAQPKKKKKITPPAAATKKSSKSKPGKKEKSQSTIPQLSAKDKKKPATKVKPEKERFVTYSEKQAISNGIAQLDEKRMNQALQIIQNNIPNLQNTDQTEIELDIDELPNNVLMKLLNFVKRYVPQALPAEMKPEPSYSPVVASSKPKKNKPMTKHEQEAQIEELKGKLGHFGSPTSPEPAQSIEKDHETSGDEDDSEESEEE